MAGWAARDGCEATATDAGTLDLEPSLPGPETEVARHGSCRGGAAELWTMRGAGHIPELAPDFMARVYAFLLAHARP